MKPTTEWEFYKSTEEAWEAMLGTIRDARETIDLEQFILINDEVGSKFLNLLIEKASQGVSVRILCDEVGSYATHRSSIVSELRNAGAKIRFFNPLVPWHPHNESLWYFRDHRKLLIIDAKIGYTGGICIAERMRGWRESSVKISGPVVEQMLQSFNIMWDKHYRKPNYYLSKYNGRQQSEKTHFSYLANSPLPKKRFMYRELVKNIQKAKHYLYLTTPYFAPDHTLLRSIKAASKRGVKTILLIPAKTNVKLAGIAARTYFESLYRSRVRIFQYDRSMIHSKTAVIDGSWSTIGSLNLDNASLRYNFEANIVSTDKRFCFELEKQFLDDLKISNELTQLEFKNRPFISKFFEFLVRPIRSFL